MSYFESYEILGLPLENVRGHAFDNGANIGKRIYWGVNNDKKINHCASSTQCVCHSLNLVINDMAKSSLDGKIINIVQKLYLIFLHHILGKPFF